MYQIGSNVLMYRIYHIISEATGTKHYSLMVLSSAVHLPLHHWPAPLELVLEQSELERVAGVLPQGLPRALFDLE